MQEHKFFDSADWALNKEAAAKKGTPGPSRQVPDEDLKPKLEPTGAPGNKRAVVVHEQRQRVSASLSV